MHALQAVAVMHSNAVSAEKAAPLPFCPALNDFPAQKDSRSPLGILVLMQAPTIAFYLASDDLLKHMQLKYG